MNRQEMIEILIEDRFEDWIYARNTDGLEDTLRYGWKGLDDCTDKELKEALEDVDIKECKELIKQGVRKGGSEK